MAQLLCEPMKRAIASAVTNLRIAISTGAAVIEDQPLEFIAKLFRLHVNTVRQYSTYLSAEPSANKVKRGQRAVPNVSLSTVDTSTRMEIRNILYDMRRKGCHITLATLLKEIRTRGTTFEGGRSSLHKLVRELGFRYQLDDGRRVLKMNADVIQKKRNFKREYMADENSLSPSQVVF
ncbi:uncharacterized protein LOC107268736 [Cephus cinctus]|uniref:Uncharacterized protein LOC107268736 n=1 Tax=Cephus cinctus TaxID=211228 RepID=A0AAJ7BY37_CEPCN|nr:uncharacterized protein LOC107268736 [Cephus cinctus]